MSASLPAHRAASDNDRDARTRRRQDGRVCRFAAPLVELGSELGVFGTFEGGWGSASEDVMRGPCLLGGIG